MNIEIKAKSSDGEHSYNVKFNYDGKVTVFCDCPAGIHGKFCKHKWELMNGNTSMLFNEDDKVHLNQVLEWIEKSDFKNLYIKVNELEKQMQNLKKQIQKEKKEVERRFREGF